MFIIGCLNSDCGTEHTERRPCLSAGGTGSTPQALHHHEPLYDATPHQCHRLLCAQAGTHPIGVHVCVWLMFTQKYRLAAVSGCFQPSPSEVVGTRLCKHLWEEKVNKKCSGVLQADVHPQVLHTANWCCSWDALTQLVISVISYF